MKTLKLRPEDAETLSFYYGLSENPGNPMGVCEHVLHELAHVATVPELWRRYSRPRPRDGWEPVSTAVSAALSPVVFFNDIASASAKYVRTNSESHMYSRRRFLVVERIQRQADRRADALELLALATEVLAAKDLHVKPKITPKNLASYVQELGSFRTSGYDNDLEAEIRDTMSTGRAEAAAARVLTLVHLRT